MDVTLQTFTGTNTSTGELVVWDLDEVKVNGVRTAFIRHYAGAPIQFIRLLTQIQIDAIHAECVKQRAAQGKPPIAGEVAKLPDPKKASPKGKHL